MHHPVDFVTNKCEFLNYTENKANIVYLHIATSTDIVTIRSGLKIGEVTH